MSCAHKVLIGIIAKVSHDTVLQQKVSSNNQQPIKEEICGGRNLCKRDTPIVNSAYPLQWLGKLHLGLGVTLLVNQRLSSRKSGIKD